MKLYTFVNKQFISRLGARFTLRDYQDVPDATALSGVIQMVTNIDQLLQLPQILEGDEVASAAGQLVLYTIPLGKRFTLYGVRCVRSTGAALQFDSTQIIAPNLNYIVLESYAATNNKTTIPTREFALDQGWQIAVNISTHNPGDKVRAYIWAGIEDAF